MADMKKDYDDLIIINLYILPLIHFTNVVLHFMKNSTLSEISTTKIILVFSHLSHCIIVTYVFKKSMSTTHV